TTADDSQIKGSHAALCHSRPEPAKKNPASQGKLAGRGETASGEVGRLVRIDQGRIDPRQRTLHPLHGI
ncbi:MAG: hypothetical protein Q7T30_02535, partial [Planctomycetota bacterium]|nr:hypothetical protein [Planctomycetota bacterium]